MVILQRKVCFLFRWPSLAAWASCPLRSWHKLIFLCGRAIKRQSINQSIYSGSKFSPANSNQTGVAWPPRTLQCLWGTTSVVSHEPILASCSKSDAFDVVYTVTHVQCSLHALFLHDWITAMRHIQVCLVVISMVCRPSKMLLLGSYWARESFITWHHCYVKDTGFRSSTV